MYDWRHRFRTFFDDGTHRDIMGQTTDGARRAAVSWHRTLGFKGKPYGATLDMGHLGTDGDTCPLCASKGPTLLDGVK